MAKRDCEIEQEVQKRLLAAKQLLEKEMQLELEKQKQSQFKAFLEKEVLEHYLFSPLSLLLIKKTTTTTTKLIFYFSNIYFFVGSLKVN